MEDIEVLVNEGEPTSDAISADTYLDAEDETLEATTPDLEADPEGTSLECAKLIEEAVAKAAQGDCGAPFEELVLHALLALRTRDKAGWMRMRARMKHANKDVSLVQLDKVLSQLARDLKEVAPTHHGYARSVLAKLAVGLHMPVSVHGQLYVPCMSTQLWDEISIGELQARIAQAHDGKENCTREEDYFAIAKLAVALVERPDFFEKAPVGVACLRSLYSLRDGVIFKEPLDLLHRQVTALPFEPMDMPTPLYDAFRRDTFQTPREGEEVEQIRLLDEFAGATMMGIAFKYQKAFVWTEPFGRAGKGTMQRILGCLVPSDLTCAISPMDWCRGKEYHVATLAGKRLNVVGELPEDKKIPAAEFKSVLGLDTITGRWPTLRPFTFENRAAHLFMSNHTIKTSEHSEAFYGRWVLIEFPNSLLKSGKAPDPSLAERIIKAELPGIAFKALQGAARLLKQGSFSHSKAHDRLMAEWRRSSSPLQEFIHESCELGEKLVIRRSYLYREFVNWCKDNGQIPWKKGRFMEALPNTLRLGLRHSVLDGYEVVRGIRIKPGFASELDLAFVDVLDKMDAEAGELAGSEGQPDF